MKNTEDWRVFGFVPKLVSKLIQTGFFAITVFYQTGWRLIVDFVFLCLFMVLMVFRPIQSWVHLLEDEKHKKMRLLRHYIQWVPDIIQKRYQMRCEMEEVISSSLKERHKVREVQIPLSVINAAYQKDLQWIKDKIQKHQLDEEYGHLIDMAQWWEGKRAHKMSRLYACELNFLEHPSQSLHNSNLQKYKNEMLVFEAQVNNQYRAVESYTVPKVPLWSETCGLKGRTRKETQQVLIKCLPHGRFAVSILILLNLLFIYRGPTLIKKLWMHWYDRRNTVFNSTKEYLLDLLTVLRILLVILLLFRAPSLIADITQDIFLKRSWKAVRETAKRYQPYIWKDLFDLFSALLSRKEDALWVFNLVIFMPLWLCFIIPFLKYFPCVTSIFYYLLIVFLFVFPNGMAHEFEGTDISVVIGVFAIFLLAVLIFMAVVMMKKRLNPMTTPEPYDYIHFNWTNVHVIISQIFELLQLLAMVFVISDLPMMGASTLNMASNHLLLNFASFKSKMWITLFLFAAWDIGISVLFFDKRGHVGWTLFLSLFGNTLFVTFIGSFLTFVSCRYTDCPRLNVHNMDSSSTNSCASAVLYEDSNLMCWEGDHRAIATAGLLGLVWYTTTALLSGFRYGDLNRPTQKLLNWSQGSINPKKYGILYQDLKFSLIYNTFIKFVKAFMIGVVILAASSPKVVVGCLIFANIAAVLFTVVYKHIFHHQPANSFVLKLWRQVSFLCGAVAAVAAMVAQTQNKEDNLVPLMIFLGGCGGVLIFAVVISITRSRRMTPIEETRQEVRDRLRRLERQLVQSGHMINSWSKGHQTQWNRLVKRVREAQENDCAIPNYPNMFKDPTPSPEDALQSSQGTSLPSHEADTLPPPPPPPYEDLFPNILVPHGEERRCREKSLEARPPQFYDDLEQSLGLSAQFLRELERSRRHDPLLALESNGVNLLLLLEQHIHYSAFSFALISQLRLWRASVRKSNWVGLLHCLQTLENNLNGNFNKPTQMDVSSADATAQPFILPRDPDHEELPEVWSELGSCEK